MRALTFRVVAASFCLAIFISPASAQPKAQMTFATTGEAAATLLDALRSNDLDKLRAIFGPDAAQVLSSGDPIQDKNDREVFTVAMGQSFRWNPRGASARELVVGADNWPFPIPLVRQGNNWRFDTAAGAREVLARRVGRNELTVIKLCQGYVHIQGAYASEGRDGKPAGVYAQKVRSESGRHDGLYWEVSLGETPSPLGDLAAQAATEGYDREKEPSVPFHGYYFRILTAQGPAAGGGVRSYIVDGDMSRGFALVAYPANYRNSGVMTFIVNQDGVVYEKDLGKETANLAAEMKVYNPDKTWRRAKTTEVPGGEVKVKLKRG